MVHSAEVGYKVLHIITVDHGQHVRRCFRTRMTEWKEPWTLARMRKSWQKRPTKVGEWCRRGSWLNGAGGFCETEKEEVESCKVSWKPAGSGGWGGGWPTKHRYIWGSLSVLNNKKQNWVYQSAIGQMTTQAISISTIRILKFWIWLWLRTAIPIDTCWGQKI